MGRRLLPVAALGALFCVGCVPVTEPVGDIEKAEPDKNLVGKWDVTDSRGTAAALNIKSLTVEAPEVKGNPKGLLRVAMTQEGGENNLWFITHTVGKHTYVSLILAPSERDEIPNFSKEGEFEKWNKKETKRYFISHCLRDGDKLTLDCGNLDTFTTLMTDSKIPGDGTKPLEYFRTPAGWLAKYLDKTGPKKIFDGTNELVLARKKK
jgi:hypothetical protein